MTDFNSMILGCDVSHYQPNCDFVKMKAAGIEFCIVKEAQSGREDPLFLTNINAAADAGMITFIYPFILPTDTQEDVDFFYSISGGCVPALDVETQGITDPVIDRYMKTYEDKSGRVGLHYHGFWPVVPVDFEESKWPWWLAEYSDSPRAPAWDGISTPDWTKSWLLWQFTGSGTIDGCPEKIDLSRCGVSRDALLKFHNTGTV